MSYLRELDKLSKKITVRRSEAERWMTQEWSYVKISFDVAMNKQGNRSCSGTIIRDLNGRVLGSKTVIMDNIPITFATKALACATEGMKNEEQLYLQNEMLGYARATVERDRRW
ncbi:hypothetical protein Gohar_017056, partial [Gossypium harknessii]|nr:hypothetical protein [Gossypium harknessii]